MKRLVQWFKNTRNAPWSVWLVVLMSTCVAVSQYPTYNPIPPLIPYVLGTGLLIVSFAIGARWAFVFCFLTAWIFPLETWLGIKGMLHGGTLSALHFLSLLLLYHGRAYFWGRSGDQDDSGNAAENLPAT
jgi:hypothetical protein